MERLEDRVVESIFTAFDALPTKSKPRRPSSDGVQEWVPLSGIAIVKDENVTCVSLGTGMKCLPATNPILLVNDNVLHDWHAEILALRAFNHFLLEEVRLLASSLDYESVILQRRATYEITQEAGKQPFGIRENMRIMMYCSEAPCGDASMELVMEAQEDATPWPIALKDDGTPAQLLGRGSFSQLGVVRRKPSRSDSPPTLSKSCSDKLALKQCTSLLSSPTSLLISPTNAYLSTLILPASQYRSAACDRCFSATGRMSPVTSSIWAGGYSFQPFTIATTPLEFEYSRRVSPPGEIKGCNISAVWNPHVQETLINGVLQGRKQVDARGASVLSRSRLFALFREVDSKLDGLGMMSLSDYRTLKKSTALEDRRLVKSVVRADALRGWSTGGDDALVASRVVL